MRHCLFFPPFSSLAWSSTELRPRTWPCNNSGSRSTVYRARPSDSIFLPLSCFAYHLHTLYTDSNLRSNATHFGRDLGHGLILVRQPSVVQNVKVTLSVARYIPLHRRINSERGDLPVDGSSPISLRREPKWSYEHVRDRRVAVIARSSRRDERLDRASESGIDEP